MSKAQVHTFDGIRAKKKPKKEQTPKEDRKDVFKSVLDNPFQIRWPILAHNVQNMILASLIELVQNSGIPEYHIGRDRAHRKGQYKKRRDRASKPVQSNPSSKRKRSEGSRPEGGERIKSRRLDHNVSNEADPVIMTEEVDTTPLPSPPPLLTHMKFGVNEVTKQLDAHVLSSREHPTMPRPETTFVFACPHDVNPTSLLGHLPMLVAVCNATCRSRNIQSRVLLAPLPRGSEALLAHTIKQRRISILTLTSSAQGIGRLLESCSGLPILSAPWLVSPEPSGTNCPKVVSSQDPAPAVAMPPAPLLPTNIKQIRTTGPKDMRATREARVKGRAQAKARRIGRTAIQGDTIVVSL